MFLEACVILFTGGGAHGWGVCKAGCGGVHSWGLEGGMCLAGEGVPPYGLQAGGMHPTEILSCL